MKKNIKILKNATHINLLEAKQAGEKLDSPVPQRVMNNTNKSNNSNTRWVTN
jgi:ribosomal protein L7/L12